MVKAPRVGWGTLMYGTYLTESFGIHDSRFDIRFEFQLFGLQNLHDELAITGHLHGELEIVWRLQNGLQKLMLT